MFQLTVQWLVVAVDVSVKALLLAALAVLAMRLFELRDSNVRHRIWLGVLMAMLLLPALSQLIPALGLPVPVVAGWATSEWGDVEPLDAAAARLDAADTEPVAVPESLARGSSVRDSLPFGFNHEPWNEPAMEPARHGFSDDGDWGMMAPPLASDVDTESMDTTSNPAEHAEPALAALASQYDPLPFRSAGITVWLPLVLFAVWLTGATVMGLRLLLAMFFTWQLKRRSHRIEWDALARLGIDLQQWSSRRPITVAESSQIGVPLTAGALRPWILLPAGWNEWPAAKLRAVLTHEGTHVERGDCAVALLAEVNRCLYWFHPLAWWLRRRLYALAEEACDDAAIKTTGDRALYARHLLEVASVVSADQGRLIHTGVSMARRSNVETRIHAILDFTRPLSQRLTWSTTLLLSAVIVPVIVLAAALTPLSGQDESIPAQEVEAIVAADLEESDDQEVPEADGQDISQSGGGPDQLRESDAGRRSGGGNETATAVNDGPYRFFGQVLDPDGNPVRGARVQINKTRKPRFYAGTNETTLLAESTAGDDGRFEQRIERDQLPKPWRHPFGSPPEWINVIASAEGYGVAVSTKVTFDDEEPLELRLVADEPIRGRVLDLEGRPVEGAQVDVFDLMAGDPGRLDEWLEEVSGRDFAWDENALRMSAYSMEAQGPDVLNFPAGRRFMTAPADLPEATTNAEGRFEVAGLGKDRLAILRIRGPGITTTLAQVLTRPIEPLQARGTGRTLVRHVYFGSNFDYVAEPSAPVEGVLRDIDTGEPLAGALVMSRSIGGEIISAEGFLSTVTDQQGRYRLEGLPVSGENRLQVMPDGLPYLITPRLSAPMSEGLRPVEFDIELKRAVWVTGRVYDVESNEPVRGTLHYTPFTENEFLEGYPQYVDGTTTMLSSRVDATTDEEGRFRIPVIPGRGLVCFQAEERIYRSGFGAEKIPGFDNEEEFRVPGGLTRDHVLPALFHALLEVNPQPDEVEIEQDVPVDPGMQMTLKFVDLQGNALTKVQAAAPGVNPLSNVHRSEPDTAPAYGLSPDETRYINITHLETGYRRLLALTPEPDETERTVVLGPPAVITGRLLTPEDEPLRDVAIAARYQFKKGMEATITPLAQTDAEGRFESEVPEGGPYQLSIASLERFNELHDDLTVAAGERVDLGDLVVDPDQPRQPARPKRPPRRTLPETTSADRPDSRAAPRLIVSLRNDGAVVVDGRPLSQAAFISIFSDEDAVARFSEQYDVELRGESGVTDEQLEAFLKRCRDAGIGFLRIAAGDSHSTDAAQREAASGQREYPIDSSGSSTLARSQPSTGLGNDSSQTAVAQETKTTTVTGRVTSDGDRPAREAHVAVIAMRMQNTRSGEISPSGDVLAEGTTDENGRYELKLAGVSSKTHRYANVVARKEGAAIAWRQIDLDADNADVRLQLLPEQPVHGRLIDIEGQPAAGVRLSVAGVGRRSENGRPWQGVGFRGGENVPAAWLPSITSDEQGRFVIPGVPADHGVSLQVAENDRFAPQQIVLNTGASEQRGERDGTYRPLIRNVNPGEEAVLPLSPAQWFEGSVRYEDTDEPAPHAPVTIWASQEELGSMSLVSGKTDENGRFRINPNPGIRFGVKAYPPEGVPYLTRQTPLFSEGTIRWETGDTLKQVDMTLPRGVLVRGQVINSDTKAPIAGAAVQYHPESANNSNDSSDIVTGWNAIQVSDEEGRFAIPVLPGPGRLLVHGPQGEYVLHEIGERQLSRGTPGGIRYYAHAIENLDPQAGAESIELEIELQPGATVTGRIVDERGEPIEEVQIISRLDILASVPFWRGHTTPPTLGGRFEISGLAEDQEYPVYFLDAKRKLGATEMLRAGEAERTVVLQPCGTAHLRLVDSDGEPVAGSVPVEMVVTPGAYRYDTNALRNGELAADSDFLVNIDRTNYSFSMNSDDEGRFHLPALIPGASYRIVWYRVDRLETVKEFQVEPNETLELGDIVVEPQQ